MTANAQRASATIYQFPVGGRAGLTERRTGFAGNSRGAQERHGEAVPTISYGSSWYHDEAIREAADKARKN